MKNKSVIALCLILMTVFSSCSFQSGEQLYRLPSLPVDMMDLQQQVDKVLIQGAEYAPPIGGTNRQAIQLVDLDNDGISEAIVFFRTSGENPLEIHIFKKTEDTYTSFAIIKHAGESVDSIAYRDLSGSGSLNLIVGWQIGQGAIRAMTVYSIQTGELSSLLSTSFSAFSVFDIDNNSTNELIIARLTEQSGVVEVYSYGKINMTLVSAAPMSVGLESIRRVRTGFINGKIPAFLVSCNFNQSSIVTDIFAYRQGKLANILLNPKTQMSEATIRQYPIFTEDINEDGIIDFPNPEKLPSFGDNAEEDFWIINWLNYGLDGDVSQILTTYHNNTEGWYYVIPDSWKGRLIISRVDTVSGERMTVFSRISNGKSTPFMRIYTLTGNNRYERAALPNRFECLRGTGYIITAEILNPDGLSQDFVQSKEQILSRLRYIQTEWLTGES